MFMKSESYCTLFPVSLTISALASSALSLFLHTMWIVPPVTKMEKKHYSLPEEKNTISSHLRGEKSAGFIVTLCDASNVIGALYELQCFMVIFVPFYFSSLFINIITAQRTSKIFRARISHRVRRIYTT